MLFWAIVIGLVIYFVSCIIAPFIPRETGATPVIHNHIHNIHNDYRSYERKQQTLVLISAPSQQEPKHDTSEEGLFGRYKITE